MPTTRSRLLAGAIAAATIVAATPALAQPLFWSTQVKPVEETQAMREQVLAGVAGGVDYQALDEGPWLTRLQAEAQAGSGTIAVLGALHGELAGVAATLADVSDIDTSAVIPALMELGKLGSDQQL
jgi:multiple sugar transport system substrate-binding protein